MNESQIDAAMTDIDDLIAAHDALTQAAWAVEDEAKGFAAMVPAEWSEPADYAVLNRSVDNLQSTLAAFGQELQAYRSAADRAETAIQDLEAAGVDVAASFGL